MNYENAKKGIGQIFTAEILQLISGILILIGTIITVIGTVSVLGAASAGMDNAFGAAAVGAVGGLILNAVGAILAFIGFIMYIVGVGNASKDEANFKKAMVFLILGLIVSIVSAFTGGVANGVLRVVLTIVGELFQLISAICVINGIISLAGKVGNAKVEAKGHTTLGLIVTIIILSIIASVISSISNAVAPGVIGGIISLIAAILSVCRYFIYLSLLANARKMF